MALPPLYKYLDVQGAKLTLGTKKFKHAKPSGFNDTEDLTIQSIFPEETELALKRLETGFTDVILAHLNDPPTCSSPMKEKVGLIQQVYRTNPEAADMIKAELAREGKAIYDIEHMRALTQRHVDEINDFMQGYRVLCVTSHKNSDKMWSRYAEDHKGVVLRVEPNLAKDSKFQLFRAVVYRDKRPSLYDDTLEIVAQGLFGDQMAHRKAMVEKIIYSKTLKWQHEGEYRLAIPVSQNEEPWDTLPYHSEEITELYLGAETAGDDKNDILSKAVAVNPKIAIFEARRSDKGQIDFERIR